MKPEFRRVELRSEEPLRLRHDPACFVLTSSEELERVYGVRSLEDRVDWGEELLLVAERGECPTGGYRVEFRRLVLDPPGHPQGTLLAEVVETDPRPTDFVTMMITYPRAAVAVRRLGLEKVARVVFACAAGRILTTTGVAL